MKRKPRFIVIALWTVLLGVLSAGCAGRELLDEIPRDFALLWEKPETAEEGLSQTMDGSSPGMADGSLAGAAGGGPAGTGGESAPGTAGISAEQAEYAAGSGQGADSASVQGVQTSAGGRGNIPRTLAENLMGGAREPEIAVSFLMEEAFTYARDCLSEAEQIWYRDIERILGSFGEGAALSREGLKAGLEESQIDKIFQCVLCDHPELFFVEGYSYTKYMRGEELLSIEFSGNYCVDLETALTRSRQIRTAADAILAGVEPDASDYEKVKYVYDTLILNTDYDLDAPDNQNIYSVFVSRRSVCQGYAKATQYLLNRLGIECVLVLGTVETGEGHAWNLVKVDGHYYFVDTTWGDVSYRIDETLPWEGGMPEINYDFLNVTTEELLRTHIIGGEVPMPLCTAVEANYYVREGALFTSFDREQLRVLFERAAERGRRDVAVKCSNAECYEEILQALIGEQEIFGLLPGGESSIAYTQNEKQFSLTFWVTNE